MALALGDSGTVTPSATALREVPDPDAQRSLMALVLDPSRALAIRKHCAVNVVRSIRRFGPLVTADQEAQLLTSVREETDPDFHNDLMAVFRALRPPRSPLSQYKAPASPVSAPAAGSMTYPR